MQLTEQLTNIFASLDQLDVPTLELVMLETIRVRKVREELDSQRFSIGQVVTFYGPGEEIIKGDVQKIRKGRLYIHAEQDPSGRARFSVPPSHIIGQRKW